MNRLLWGIQILLALLFLFAGGMKLILPIAEMTKQMPFPGWLLRFIGVMEVLGGLGLILPWGLGIRPRLTPLAAIGLTIIMAGAVALTVGTGQTAAAVLPLVVGLLTIFIAYQRWHTVPGKKSRDDVDRADLRSI
jgi:hypothetical protein